MDIANLANDNILWPKGIRLTVYSRYLRGFTRVTRVTRHIQRLWRLNAQPTLTILPAIAAGEGGLNKILWTRTAAST